MKVFTTTARVATIYRGLPARKIRLSGIHVSVPARESPAREVLCEFQSGDRRESGRHGDPPGSARLAAEKAHGHDPASHRGGVQSSAPRWGGLLRCLTNVAARSHAASNRPQGQGRPTGCDALHVATRPIRGLEPAVGAGWVRRSRAGGSLHARE